MIQLEKRRISLINQPASIICLQPSSIKVKIKTLD